MHLLSSNFDLFRKILQKLDFQKIYALANKFLDKSYNKIISLKYLVTIILYFEGI